MATKKAAAKRGTKKRAPKSTPRTVHVPVWVTVDEFDGLQIWRGAEEPEINTDEINLTIYDVKELRNYAKILKERGPAGLLQELNLSVEYHNDPDIHFCIVYSRIVFGLKNARGARVLNMSYTAPTGRKRGKGLQAVWARTNGATIQFFGDEDEPSEFNEYGQFALPASTFDAFGIARPSSSGWERLYVSITEN